MMKIHGTSPPSCGDQPFDLRADIGCLALLQHRLPLLFSSSSPFLLRPSALRCEHRRRRVRRPSTADTELLSPTRSQRSLHPMTSPTTCPRLCSPPRLPPSSLHTAVDVGIRSGAPPDAYPPLVPPTSPLRPALPPSPYPMSSPTLELLGRHPTFGGQQTSTLRCQQLPHLRWYRPPGHHRHPGSLASARTPSSPTVPVWPSGPAGISTLFPFLWTKSVLVGHLAFPRGG